MSALNTRPVIIVVALLPSPHLSGRKDSFSILRLQTFLRRVSFQTSLFPITPPKLTSWRNVSRLKPYMESSRDHQFSAPRLLDKTFSSLYSSQSASLPAKNGCLRACAAVSRLVQSKRRSFVTKSRASSIALICFFASSGVGPEL